MTATALLEPSFADLLAAIAQAPELSEQRRRHWACSLQQIAKWLDRPAAVIPARWTAIQLSVGQLHHARVGVTAKTLANHKSNVRAALRWLGKEHGVPQRGVRLSPEWARFCDGLEKRIRDRLYNLADFMHAKVWSERQFLLDVRVRSARARRQLNRIEDAVDALEVTGRARGGHLRPGCSWSRRL